MNRLNAMRLLYRIIKIFIDPIPACAGMTNLQIKRERRKSKFNIIFM